jgi:hypothetical protein
MPMTRQREFGIRSALGATAVHIIRLIARQGASLLIIGFAAGGIVTSGLVRSVRNQWSAMPTPNLVSCVLTAVVLSRARLDCLPAASSASCADRSGHRAPGRMKNF